MGHPQPLTIIKNDNSTAVGFTNKNIQLKQSKSWDMNLHWLQDREKRKHFKIMWERGAANTTDYLKKNTLQNITDSCVLRISEIKMLLT